MTEIMKKYKHYILPICLILVLSFSRAIPHPPNFTPILAVGIFSGFYFAVSSIFTPPSELEIKAICELDLSIKQDK